MRRILAFPLVMLLLLAVPVAAADPMPTPDCHGINVTDKEGDNVETTTGNQGSPSTDITGGWLTFDPASGKATANGRVANLTAGEVDPPHDGISWEFGFTTPSGPMYVRGFQDITGMTKWTWGEPRLVTDDQTAPRRTGTTSGALFPGKGGVVQIDIPLKDMGIAVGATLKALTIEVRQWVTLPAAVPSAPPQVPLYSYAPPYDDAAGKGQFLVGPCPAGSTPAAATPVTTPAVAAPASLGVTVKVGRLSAKKVSKTRRIAIKLSGKATGLQATLRQGAGGPEGRIVAAGKLASLNGAGKLTLKLKGRLKKGRYMLVLTGRNASGQPAEGRLAVKVS
jgi:hypothetical protein